MAYRSDIDALEARKAALDSELADRTRERDEIAVMLADARARQAAEVAAIEAPRRRRRFAQIYVASVLVFVVAGVIGFARTGPRVSACFHGPPEPEHPMAVEDFDRELARYATLTEQLCACRDDGCRDDAMARVKELWTTSPLFGSASTGRDGQISLVTSRLDACVKDSR